MTDMTPRAAAVAALTTLPLYQLSTAGMELFHTNFLYWLAVHRPDESAPLWSALGLHTVHDAQQERFIRREWRHVDLLFAPGVDQPALVIENKIGAIPTAEQLRRYQRDVSPYLSAMSAKVEYVLLTLTPPTFTLPKPWRSVTYRDLLPALRETAGQLSGDEAVLLSSYTAMVARLDEVARLYDPAGTLHEAVRLSQAERSALLEARLLSLVEKVRAGRFAELATREITDAHGEIGEVGSGLSNGWGFNEWFILGRAGRRFGWQIQGEQLRLAIVTGPKDPRPRPKREELVRDLYEEFFDLTPPVHLGHTLEKYMGNKVWLGYEPNFVYRYARITPNTTWTELLTLALWFTRQTYAFLERTR